MTPRERDAAKRERDLVADEANANIGCLEAARDAAHARADALQRDLDESDRLNLECVEAINKSLEAEKARADALDAEVFRLQGDVAELRAKDHRECVARAAAAERLLDRQRAETLIAVQRTTEAEGRADAACSDLAGLRILHRRQAETIAELQAAITKFASGVEAEADRYHEDPRGAVFDNIAFHLRALAAPAPPPPPKEHCPRRLMGETLAPHACRTGDHSRDTAHVQVSSKSETNLDDVANALRVRLCGRAVGDDECVLLRGHEGACSAGDSMDPAPRDHFNYRFVYRGEACIPVGCVKCGQERPLRYVDEVPVCRRCFDNLDSPQRRKEVKERCKECSHEREVPDVLCNLCGLSCTVGAGDHAESGGLIRARASGGYESTPGNGCGALDDTVAYTFSLCEFCLDWLFGRFVVPVATSLYMEGDAPDVTWRPAAERVAADYWRTMKQKFEDEAARRAAAREARFDRTIFGCRTCDRSTWGWTDGRFVDAGWSRIDNIDGPNAICPHCQQDDAVLDGLREDYPSAAITPIDDNSSNQPAKESK